MLELLLVYTLLISTPVHYSLLVASIFMVQLLLHVCDGSGATC
jgi:hypothetical protein